ncbi:hypothetical protein GLOIN_2v1738116 [Rhizophagus irregularis DAOM 181602=DAOM 197198]|uniref:Uncharacterized protein n=1 Tax=Rhizophagus irregularis (strain DAOM 181602 / DAOM 197198 / MUCL 43194) TaxID=747089 RepID=A0A2P4NX11_RHIID|nr:hypothetical protein GLOIN_2v1738067 [Rhizophagus irregularis DAOM 181602=DAOM 197198]XP_025164509.1 hypothetical protein GLOIN_2v1738116 [Rhizophagus irregularis DAOM 181602=DAOM 197198]POG57638.1 hypothetical protein GLOIN_2v1738067 [Rhizophagus irregularis DAOM 181602=DAOM 197198]POG57643.1 hypothetical protein GLOIN_2v1738116 [Rhizophagus irregularis DAOM 181602=DAOM 197198]|eukprot:XP_025164504.1 hypothetical protein GLOIN_2v1738067 [Rhizophagus irregularis DAOM 181602=DAOM 197198]
MIFHFCSIPLRQYLRKLLLNVFWIERLLLDLLRQMFDIRHVMRIRQSHNFTALMMPITGNYFYD